MKIYTYFEEDGRVGYVRVIDGDEKHTEQEYVDKAKKLNENLKREAYVIFDIEDPRLVETILYLLGEKKYKSYADLDDLDTTLNEVSGDIQSLHNDAFEMYERMEAIERMFEDFKNKYIR